MATELSNYAKDYRVRYRLQSAPAEGVPTVRWDGSASNYNVVQMPPEATYSLYSSGAGTASSPFKEEHLDQGAATSITSYYTLPKNDGLGGINGRYSLDFVDDTGSAGFNIPRSATPPASPSEGNLWFDTVNLALMIYFNDGNSTQWIAAS